MAFILKVQRDPSIGSPAGTVESNRIKPNQTRERGNVFNGGNCLQPVPSIGYSPIPIKVYTVSHLFDLLGLSNGLGAAHLVREKIPELGVGIGDILTEVFHVILF